MDGKPQELQHRKVEETPTEDNTILAKEKYAIVGSGQFAANMRIALENDGPATFSLRA